jgi:hypothetical protein
VRGSAAQCRVAASPTSGSGYLAVSTDRRSGDQLGADHPELLIPGPCNTPCTKPSSVRVRVRVRVRVVPRPPFPRGSYAASGPHLGAPLMPADPPSAGGGRDIPGDGQPSPWICNRANRNREGLMPVDLGARGTRMGPGPGSWVLGGTLGLVTIKNPEGHVTDEIHESDMSWALGPSKLSTPHQGRFGSPALDPGRSHKCS